ncbi:MAG: hypothetical protein PHT33_04060 [bacterium]|nr:hypothetical protein [bacterium]
MKKVVALLFTAVLCFTVLSKCSEAAPTEIGLKDLIIMRYRVPASGLTPLQRAAETRRRMVRAIDGAPLRSSSVTMSMRSGMPVIVANGVVLATVTPADARANATTQMDVARVWLRNFQMRLPGYQAWARYNR